jgi:type VI protein secretion system component Hcp
MHLTACFACCIRFAHPFLGQNESYNIAAYTRKKRQMSFDTLLGCASHILPAYTLSSEAITNLRVHLYKLKSQGKCLVYRVTKITGTFLLDTTITWNHLTRDMLGSPTVWWRV